MAWSSAVAYGSDAVTSTTTCKGYSARIEYDDEDGLFTGRIAGIRDGVGFHAGPRQPPKPTAGPLGPPDVPGGFS